ncbi:MAG TPA: hypothetical protein DE117_00935 [Fervidobacterium sp.]|nr:hypothetical protein [Fervidobacterium sp.]
MNEVVRVVSVHHVRGYVHSLQYHVVWCVKYRHKMLHTWKYCFELRKNKIEIKEIVGVGWFKVANLVKEAGDSWL